ncbi:SGNH/GDSL hydrolase family protein [Bacillus sp. T33-2]|uniref:SGNH/GDSL hydrolase family protein n=1 Tax=Bacillus sp. T33-2 TaxID=2054168 RepID=UPI000C7935A5|nr:SGNH/GDSL hydrolase family protein [Bacillus sp. T33-2]PLR98880.1 SGNH/GDSL hydrolase family protein [Bacillus sp. T33-2]
MTRRVAYIFSGFCLFLLILYVAGSLFGTDHTRNYTVYDKISRGMKINYLVIGDSIGRGSGAETKEMRWYSQLEALLEHYNGVKASRHSIVQSGATAFEGLYKLQNSRKLRNVDLIFIVFGENDRKYMSPEEFSFFYEKLLRHAKTLYPRAEIVTITESCLKQDPYAEKIKQISDHYRAKNVDMRIPFKQSGLLTEELTADMVHPNGLGYQLYANTIHKLLRKNSQLLLPVARLKKPLRDSLEFSLKELPEFSLKKGFDPVNGILTASQPGSFIEYEFKGTLLGIRLIRSESGGMMNVYVDGLYVRTISTWWPLPRERFLYVTSGMTDRKHKVRFEMVKDVSPQNVSGSSIVQVSSLIVSK